MIEVLFALLLLSAAFFLLVSTIGILRLPDFFSRAHAVGKAETLGALLFLVGIGLYSGVNLNTGKLFLIIFLIAITNPTGIHTLTRAALKKGMEIWVAPPGGIDR